MKPPHEQYVARGAARELFTCRDREVILSGPAGTGKSLACLQKIDYLLNDRPGARALIVRKTRTSLTESAMVTFERDVLGPGNPIASGARRSHRSSYDYPNGSTIVLGGLDRPEKLYSTEWDIIYVQEAIELDEDEYEKLFRALRGTVLPFLQIIGDTNPGAPSHWIKKRSESGLLRLLESRHEDNPRFFGLDGTPTPDGVDYISKLDALTGVRKERLRYGRWVQAEGVIYTEWDARIHLIDRVQIPKTWRVWLSIDFGYTNPFSCQWWTEDTDGRLMLFREIYETQKIVADHAQEIKKLIRQDGYHVSAILCDHDAEDRATMERELGRRLTLAPKSYGVKKGIELVQQRLRRAGDGRPRLMVMRDSLVRRDPVLVEAKLPCGLTEEIEQYVWHDKRQDEPLKEHDHSCDSMRYLISYRDAGIVPGPTKTAHGQRAPASERPAPTSTEMRVQKKKWGNRPFATKKSAREEPGGGIR